MQNNYWIVNSEFSGLNHCTHLCLVRGWWSASLAGGKYSIGHILHIRLLYATLTTLKLRRLHVIFWPVGSLVVKNIFVVVHLLDIVIICRVNENKLFQIKKIAYCRPPSCLSFVIQTVLSLPRGVYIRKVRENPSDLIISHLQCSKTRFRVRGNPVTPFGLKTSLEDWELFKVIMEKARQF